MLHQSIDNVSTRLFEDAMEGIHYFGLPYQAAKIMQPKTKKPKNEVTKICNELGKNEMDKNNAKPFSN